MGEIGRKRNASIEAPGQPEKGRTQTRDLGRPLDEGDATHQPAAIPVAARAGTPKSRNAGRGAKLEPELQEYIGRELQTIYADVLSQPVPERFLELLRELDTKKAPQ